jgi:hypothetical protein
MLEVLKTRLEGMKVRPLLLWWGVGARTIAPDRWRRSDCTVYTGHVIPAPTAPLAAYTCARGHL